MANHTNATDLMKKGGEGKNKINCKVNATHSKPPGHK